MSPDRHHEFKVLVMQRTYPLPSEIQEKRLWEFFGALIAVFCFAGFGFLLLWIAGLI